LQRAIQPTSYAWFFNGIRIKPSAKFGIEEEKERAVLEINSLQKAHNGSYAVQAVGKGLQPKAEFNVLSKCCWLFGDGLLHFG